MLAWLSALERAVNRVVWGPGAMGLILCVGLVLSARCGFPQFTRVGTALRVTARRLLRGGGGGGAVSPFQALCTALAASLGTGNIAGVAGAIAAGGPGAVFWMWVSALVGMCTKYAEVVLAVRWRERNRRGEWVGGPMYYIVNGMGRRWSWLAVLFSLFGALAALGLGNLVQVNTIAGVVGDAVAGFVPAAAGRERAIALAVGLLCAAFLILVLVGSGERVGKVCALLVPVLALVYTCMSLAVIFLRREALPAVFSAIFTGAFHPQAVVGGAVGVTFRSALVSGVGRGIFSNEAGLGSAPMAHAAADAPPVEQGFFGMLEVFVDTILICTMSALVILLGVGLENVPYGTAQGAELTAAGFAAVLGPRLPAALLALCLGLFALSTLITWGLYGSRCVEFLLGERAGAAYQALFAGAAVLGGVLELEAVWRLADTLSGLMALPNLAALLALSPAAGRLTRAYAVRRARGARK